MNVAETQAQAEAMMARISIKIHEMARKLETMELKPNFDHGVVSIRMSWTGLNQKLQRDTQSYLYYAFADWAVSQELVFGEDLDKRVLNAFKSRIGSIMALEIKRQALVDAGHAKVMRLDPVLAWHLADQGIDANGFKDDVLQSTTEEVHGIIVSVKGDLIQCTLDLSPEVKWSKGVLKIKNMTLPAIMLERFNGGPASDMVDHPALATAIVLRVESNINTTMKNNVVAYTKAA